MLQAPARTIPCKKNTGLPPTTHLSLVHFSSRSALRIDVQTDRACRAARNPARVWSGTNPARHIVNRARVGPVTGPGLGQRCGTTD
jgi:hypothetical protein